MLVVALEFSMPPATKSSTMTCAYFFPGVIDAKFLAEQLHHCRSAAVVDGKSVAASLRRVVGNGDAVPGLFHFIKFTGNHGDQVGGTGYGLFSNTRSSNLCRHR